MERVQPDRRAAPLSKRSWPIGTPVDLHMDDERIVETHTTSVPMLTEGGEWRVRVRAVKGPIRLARLSYRVPPEAQASCG